MRIFFFGITLYFLLFPGLAIGVERQDHSAYSGKYNISTISVQDLTNTAKNWHILDARPGRTWKNRTIPNSLHLAWEDFTSATTQKPLYQLLPFKRLAENFEKLGLHEKSPVVLFGDTDKSWGSEGWGLWLLLRMGHQGPIRILDGGSKAWKKAGFAMNAPNHSAISPEKYSFQLNDSISIDAAEIRKNPSGYRFIDVRTKFEWFSGHIPGAVHIPWRKFATSDGHILPKEKLEVLLKKHNITLDQPIIYYCSAGVRSGFAWLVHEFAHPGVAKNFVGGMEEWEATMPKK